MAACGDNCQCAKDTETEKALFTQYVMRMLAFHPDWAQEVFECAKEVYDENAKES